MNPTGKYTNDELEIDIDYIPDSWLDDNGVRHAVIWGEGLPEYMRLEKIDGQWVLNEEAPF